MVETLALARAVVPFGTVKLGPNTTTFTTSKLGGSETTEARLDKMFTEGLNANGVGKVVVTTPMVAALNSFEAKDQSSWIMEMYRHASLHIEN